MSNALMDGTVPSDVAEMAHGRKEFGVTLKYEELALPISQSFYTKIELEAFLKGIRIVSRFMGEPQILSVRQ